MSSIASELTQAWRNAGVNEGDVVLLHSNAKRLMRRLLKDHPRGPLTRALKALIGEVRKTGTIIFPTFNFGFSRGEPFDIACTPSEMGVLSEAARELEFPSRRARSGHPIYSFVAFGAREEEINTACNSSGYGTDSPFGLLHRWGGKIAILDLPDQDAMTFYHYVEECHQVPYRYHKRFTGQYTGWDGLTSERTFGLFVRNEGIKTDVHGMEALLWGRGLYKGEKPGQGWGIRTIEARALFDCVSEIIRAGKAEGMLYTRA